MRYLFLIILCLSSFVSQSYLFAQGSKFVIQTDFVEEIMIDDQVKGEAYMVPAYIKSSGGFLITCADPKKAFLVNQDSDVINFKMLCLDNDRSTKVISMDVGQRVSIYDLLDQNEESYIWNSISSRYQKIIQYINTARHGSVQKGKAAYLQGADIDLEFNQYKPVFSSPEDIDMSWKTDKKIRTVALKYDNTLHKLKKKKPLKTSFLPSKVKKALKPGETYQVIVTLQDNSTYSSSFYIMTLNEKAEFSKFINN